MLLCLAAPHFETIYGSRGPRLLQRWALVVGCPRRLERSLSRVPRAARLRDHDGSYAPVLGPRTARIGAVFALLWRELGLDPHGTVYATARANILRKIQISLEIEKDTYDTP